jgi:Tol biopolymer transport system component
VAFIVILAIVTSCTGPPSRSGRGIIAFTTKRDGWFSIWAVRPDGTDLHKLTDIVTVEHAGESNFLDILGQPAWSPDSSRIAFTCPFKGMSEICVANTDGSDARVITESPVGPDRTPAWSPDGRIALTRFGDTSHAQIIVVNEDGTGLHELKTGHFDFGPAWSPDGSKIAFQRRTDGQDDVFVMNADGTAEHQITSTPESEGMAACHQTDGRSRTSSVPPPKTST